MCERRRRERNFGYILREYRILMPLVTKRWGHGGLHLQKVGGKSKKIGAIGPLAPAYFHRHKHAKRILYCFMSLINDAASCACTERMSAGRMILSTPWFYRDAQRLSQSGAHAKYFLILSEHKRLFFSAAWVQVPTSYLVRRSQNCDVFCEFARF